MTTSIVIQIQNGQEENEFDYVLSNIKVDEIYLLGKYQPTNNLLRDRRRIQTLAELPNDPLVLMMPKTAREFIPTVSLLDFVHPKNAIYVFGPNNEHLTKEDVGGRVPDHMVYIPTDTNDEMFNYMTCLLTLWHRRYG